MGSGSGELDDTAAATPGPALDETARSGDDGAPAAGPAAELREVSPTRYRVAGEIGRGGLGRILRARDVHLDRTVALKELLGDDDRARRRFVREALITARLQHPSIVPVYEAGRWPDHAPFYAMKLVAGKPLSDVLAAAGSLEARLAHVPTVLAAADAIAYAHAERIVHRDLKPHNVLVGAFGETVVIDWGLAKDLSIEDVEALDAGPYRSAASDQTLDGAVLGTPAYMPPEQAAGRDVDERADVYALGAMLYQVISGRSPHEDSTIDRVIAKIVAGRITPVAELEPRTPADLAAIVGKAMAREPGDRYPSARELADDLRRFTTGQLVGAHRYTLRQRARRFLRKHRALVTLGAIAIAVLAAFAVWSFRRIGAERDTAVALAHEAIQSGNRATLAQARSALAHDPTETLAWLARLDPGGPGWDTARVLAADALSRPQVTAIVDGLPAEGFPLNMRLGDGGATAIAWDDHHLVVVDVATARARSVPAGAWSPRPTTSFAMSDVGGPFACRDGRRALAYAASGDNEVVLYELDLDRGTQKIVAHDPADQLRAEAGCERGTQARVVGGALVWWTEGQTEPEMLSDRGVLRAWPTPDGHHVIAIGDDGTLLWLEPKTRKHETMGKDARLTGAMLSEAAMTSDGRLVVFGDDTYLVFQVGAPMRDLDPTVAHGPYADALAVAPDGAWIAVRGLQGLEIFDGHTLERRYSAPTIDGFITQLAASPDGRWLFVAAPSPVVIAMGPQYDTVYPLGGHERVVAGALLDGDRAVTLGSEGSLRLWKLPRRDRALAFGGGEATSPDGRWLVTQTQEDALVRIDTTGAVPDERVALPPRRVIFTLDRDSIANSGDVAFHTDQSVWLWPRGGALRHLGDVPADPMADSVQPRLAWSGGVPVSTDQARIDAWEPGGVRHVWPRGGAAPSAALAVRAWTEDLRWAALNARTAGGDATVHLADLSTGAEAALPGSRDAPVAFAPDGRSLVTGADGGGVLFWDLATRTSRMLDTGSLTPTTAAISRDGHWLAIGGNGAPLLVDLHTLAVRTLAIRTQGELLDLVFDDAGERLVVSGPPFAIVDVASGELRRVDAHQPSSVRVGPRIVFADLDRFVVVPDDLPRDPAALSAVLRAQPYELEETPGGAARIRIRR